MISQIVVASIMFLVYDYALTLPTEVQFVWLVKWTPGKVLFLLIRYPPFFSIPLFLYNMLVQIPNEYTCTWTIYCFEYMVLAQCILADIVIGLRTWVLWERRRSFTVILILTWVIVTAVATFYDHLATKQNIYTPYPVGVGLSGCLWNSQSAAPLGNMYICWTAYESFIFVVTLVRGLLHWRNKSFANLLTILYRDAFLVSLAFSVISISEIILTHTGQPMWAAAFSVLYAAAKAVLPGRIILNIREAALSLDDWDIPTGLTSSQPLTSQPSQNISTDCERLDV
ncbi:hypothetical protein CALVIDRAFT_603326 [Calocera viscosa TUFC12733]|uniref:DUF6533 domain-containing protein n=1 Tax=Calocera viscosa (strain TUFC12733) TaxID=1330018 RepID=A0A167FWL9_CALVF|nr:hypothetical protein CALVIDRAFT_603326 [Calocera viscosa TUFC12733]